MITTRRPIYIGRGVRLARRHGRRKRALRRACESFVLFVSLPAAIFAMVWLYAAVAGWLR